MVRIRASTETLVWAVPIDAVKFGAEALSDNVYDTCGSVPRQSGPAAQVSPRPRDTPESFSWQVQKVAEVLDYDPLLFEEGIELRVCWMLVDGRHVPVPQRGDDMSAGI